MKLRVLSLSILLALISAFAIAQDIAPPTPQRLDIHSKILNEDRVIWVRLPPGYDKSKAVYPVLYQTDAPGHVNETGGSLVKVIVLAPFPPETVPIADRALNGEVAHPRLPIDRSAEQDRIDERIGRVLGGTLPFLGGRRETH